METSAIESLLHVTTADLLIAGGVLGAILFVLVRYISPKVADRTRRYTDLP